MGLLFKARSQDIQGKPKVYFCAESADLAPYLDLIGEEILKNQNCCIWYPSPETDRSEADYLDDLCDMQLFVIPVTSNLIFRPSGCAKREFDLAIAKHIPVLPIMMEDDLSEPFNQIFGELQYLDRHKVDDTAIRYEEKLEKFLASVLVGDELATKVRAAFDAYVFLSYRKKDRVHAKELMHLIHKNEFCRDIAIWYDEFLTPGENFNEAIRDALRKSELFVLTVTPNLVNELNYIVTTEYPLARSEHKTILPAELVATDRTQLSEIFADLPACTDAHDDAQMAETLLAALAGVAVRENDGDAEHNFFIGLAYLSGIDVETDHNRALRLITESAEAGLVEAMDQLMRMYRTGLGVTVDLEEALRWQERKIDTLRHRHEANPTEDTFEALTRELLQCGDSYMETANPSRCKTSYEEALALSRQPLYPASAYQEAAALHSMGYYYQSVEVDVHRARALAEDSVAISRRIWQEQGTERSKRSLATGLQMLGNLCRTARDAVSARNCTEESEKLFSELYQETKNPDDLFCLMAARDTLCLLYYKRKDLWEKALEYAKENLAYSEKDAAEKKTTTAKYNLAAAYSRLGDVYEYAPRAVMLDYFEDRKNACQRSYELTKEVCNESPSPSYKRALSIGCQQLAEVTATFEGYDPSLCEEAIRLLEEVYDASPTARAKEDLAYVLAWSCYGKGDFLPTLLRAAKLREELVHERNTEASGRALYSVYQKLAKEYQKQAADPADPWNFLPYDQAPAAYDKVDEYYKKSIRVLEDLSSQLPAKGYLSILADAYNKLGHVYLSSGRRQEAQDPIRTGIAICDRQYRTEESVSACQDLLAQYDKEMGIYGSVSSTSEECLAYLQLCHKASLEYKYLNNRWKPGGSSFDPIAEAVETDLAARLAFAEDPAEQAHLALSLAQLKYYWGKSEQAEFYCLKAQELAENRPDEMMRHLAMQALELRGDVYLRCGCAQAPRDCYTEAVRLAQALPAEGASNDEIRLLKKCGDAFLAIADIDLDLSEFALPKIDRTIQPPVEVGARFRYDPNEAFEAEPQKAFEFYRSALALLEGKDDVDSLRMAGTIQSILGQKMKDALLCQEARLNAVKIFRHVHDDIKPSVQSKIDLIEACLDAGRFNSSFRSDDPGFKQCLDVALKMADELDKMEFHPDVKEILGEVYVVIENAYRKNYRDREAAKAACHRAIATYAMLYEARKDIESGKRLAKAYSRYAYYYPEFAAGYRDGVLRVLRELHEYNPEDLYCAEEYFKTCISQKRLNQEFDYWIEKAHKKNTPQAHIQLARRFRMVAQVSYRDEQKAEFYRHAYTVMTRLPKASLDEKGLQELEDAIHNARAFRQYHPHLFPEEPNS
ncbi:MAG: toll/interleukin-1 receptor domain-containing protein [Clostridia bacterium]|nr:toll/interleukin-1 receptor domain-containing protein [Clostridia bacterium]